MPRRQQRNGQMWQGPKSWGRMETQEGTRCGLVQREMRFCGGVAFVLLVCHVPHFSGRASSNRIGAHRAENSNANQQFEYKIKASAQTPRPSLYINIRTDEHRSRLYKPLYFYIHHAPSIKCILCTFRNRGTFTFFR